MAPLEFESESDERSNRQEEEFEPSQAELESAQKASGQFISRWRGMVNMSQRGVYRFDEKIRVSEEERAGVSFKDINATIGKIARQTSYFLSRFRKLPCLGFRSGERSLCSTQAFFGTDKFGKAGNRFAPGEDDKVLSDAQNSFLKQENHPMMVEMDEGEGYLRDSLTRFLAYRVGGYPSGGLMIGDATTSRILNRSQLFGTSIRMPGDIENGLMMVRVSCKSSGLRVHSSPVYFVDWSYFGDPSNPHVDGWLLPGRYIFATDGACPPEYLPDNGVFPIPSQFNPHVNKF